MGLRPWSPAWGIGAILIAKFSLDLARIFIIHGSCSPGPILLRAVRMSPELSLPAMTDIPHAECPGQKSSVDPDVIAEPSSQTEAQGAGSPNLRDSKKTA